MSDARTRRIELATATTVVLAAWLVALASYGSLDLSRDDLAYLGSAHEFQRGFESQKNYSHLIWALLHWIGHIEMAPGHWSGGRVGTVLSRISTAAVPWFACVSWRLTKAMLPDAPGVDRRRIALVAAAFAAWSPAALVGANTLSFLVRAGAVGFGLLGVALAAEALRRGSRARLAGAVLLQAVGLLIHPWAVVAPLVGFAALAWTAWSRPEGRRRACAALVGLLVADGLLFLGVWALTVTGGRAAWGDASLPWSLLFLSVSSLAHGAWQLPGLGVGATLLPIFVAAAGTALLAAWLVRDRARRGLGLLLLGGAAAALPELGGFAISRDWVMAWTGNHIKAQVGMELIAPAAAAALFVRVGGGRGRFRGPLLAVGALLLAGSLGRGAMLAHHKADVAGRDAAGGLLLAKAVMVPAAQRGARPILVGPPGRFFQASFATRFNPELPLSRVPGKYLKEKTFDGGRRGIDAALWQTSVLRCELWLGLGDGAAPAPRTARSPRNTACNVRPMFARRPPVGANTCWVDFRGDAPASHCGELPAHAPPSATLDPKAPLRALLGALALLLGGAVGFGTGRRD